MAPVFSKTSSWPSKLGSERLRALLRCTQSEEELIIEQLRKDSEIRSQRRELREKAKRIKEKYCYRKSKFDLWKAIDIPAAKYLKLAKACGDYRRYNSTLSDDSSVDDLDEDSFFGNSAKEQKERQEFIREVENQENERPPLADKQLLEAVQIPKPMENEIIITDHRANDSKNITFSSAWVKRYLEFLSTDQWIMKFLRYDYCMKRSDKWLLAVVYVYFVRTGFQFTRDSFFTFLYLANEMYEDAEGDRFEILAWMYGENWKYQYQEFDYGYRMKYWKSLNLEVMVLRETLEQLFLIDPQNPIWSRQRAEHHAGVDAIARCIQDYEFTPISPSGTFKSPEYCERCVKDRAPAALPTMYQDKRLPPKKCKGFQYNKTPATSSLTLKSWQL